jgi:phage-related protein
MLVLDNDICSFTIEECCDENASNHYDGTERIFSNILSGVGSIVGSVVKPGLDLINKGLQAVVPTLIDALFSGFSVLGNIFVDLISKVLPSAGTMLKNIKELFFEFIDIASILRVVLFAMVDGIKTIVDELTEFVAITLRFIAKKIQDVFKAIMIVILRAIDTIINIIREIPKLLSQFTEKAGDSATSLINSIRRLARTTGNIVSDVANTFNGELASAITLVKNDILFIVKSIKDAAFSTLDRTINIFSKTSRQLLNSIQLIIAKTTKIATDTIQFADDKIATIMQTTSDTVSLIPNKVKLSVDILINRASDAVNLVSEAVDESMGIVAGQATKTFEIVDTVAKKNQDSSSTSLVLFLMTCTLIVLAYMTYRTIR